MKAVYFNQHGGPEVLQYGDFPDPEIGPDEVMVRARACSLNYLDIFSRRGLPGIKIDLPSITGGDCAGEIAAMGANVRGWSVGQRVLVHPIFFDPKTNRHKMLGENCKGALAEYCVVDHSQLVALPDDVSFEDAACLPVAYGTAYRMMITRGKVQAGERVLILGASGGVGTACLLLAKMLGAHVIAAAGSAEKCQRLLAMGADEAVDYTTTRLSDYVRGKTGGLLRGGGYEVVVNFTGGDTWVDSLKCMKMDGRLLTCGATAGYNPQTDLRYIWTGELNIIGSNGWQKPDLTALLKLVSSGQLRPVIDRVVPLDQAIDACRDLEGRSFFGKIVIRP